MRRNQVLRLALLVVAVGLLVFTVVRQGAAIGDALQRLNAINIALSGAFVLAGLAAQMLSWRSLFAGSDVSVPPIRIAGRIYYLGQLGKYVPGSVWAVVAQAELGKDHRVPRARSATVALAALVVLVVVGGAVSAAGLAAGSAGSLRTYWWALVSVPVGIVLLSPPVFNRLIAIAFRLARRAGPAPAISGTAVLRSSGWALVMWLAFGAHAWFLATGLGARGAADAATVTGAFALAWVVGFLVVIAPAGAGPREAALVLALAPVMGTADAFVLALISRLLMVVGDVVTAATFARVRPAATQPMSTF
jgi:uncharacterized membrane protein YbhN (UPF0104 family)